MPAIWITADFVNGPKKPGGKYGSIKTKEYGYISVPVNDLPDFIKGRRYCVEIEETAQGYKNFIRFANEPPRQPQQSAQYPATQQPQRRPMASTPPPPIRQRQNPAIQPVQAPMGLPLDPTALNIFVTGVVGRAIGSGHFLASDIAELTREARTAFLTYMAGAQGNEAVKPPPVNNPAPQAYVDPEFNDDLPPIDLTQRSDERYYQPQNTDDDRVPF